MRTVRNIVEWGGSLIGFLWLFGPPAWQEVNRGVTMALLVVLSIIGGFGIVVTWKIVSNQIRPPYQDYDNERLGG